jgi:hypothetical protein
MTGQLHIRNCLENYLNLISRKVILLELNFRYPVVAECSISKVAVVVVVLLAVVVVVVLVVVVVGAVAVSYVLVAVAVVENIILQHNFFNFYSISYYNITHCKVNFLM